MNHSTARQIKWDIVDYLVCNFVDGEIDGYTSEDKDYVIDQIKRIALMMNVKDHVSLTEV